MNADDVQFYVSCIRTSIRPIANKLNDDLYRIYQWATANGLRLNSTKSKYLKIGARTATDISDDINDKLVYTVKSLGITFKRTIAWSDHNNQVCDNTYVMLLV